MKSQVRGGTRWKRFAVVMVPSVAATAAIGVGMAQGALAASFAVSGQEFKVTAKYLDGRGFAQYGGLDAGYTDVKGEGKTIRPVAISSFKSAKIVGMCQSVVTPDVPVFGKIGMRLEAGPDEAHAVKASNLYLDISQLDGDAKFENIDIGVATKDTGNPDMGGKGAPIKPKENVNPGGFAQQADRAVLTDVKQKAWATTAASFELSGLKLRLYAGDKAVQNECFQDKDVN
ncbi:DUF6230 family protein [Streptomyces sannanensis]|uniref:DUF6230 family protein n=1 Tax=Streptomyces sannanensis TaxID=285536 RepID=A0ABP6SG89_9ACTN